ncbi:hypothetical protein F7734_23365 [Scytonema sp. UIC 10036]|uniref:hypothetical protein n=1 Tax=Scytonema sp. UIC 10036 TaxID=2304196 RepID=UPI0012DA57CD|nr:hypothetical protein [Scytonema sp. UIC 10036]MUG95140.1 hypothetical protein [Scytonema sp. UIC 10036]
MQSKISGQQGKIMIADKLNDDLKNKIISNLNDAVKNTIENASVLLRGDVFTGSGVILFKNPEKKKFYVLTAKHNLLVAGKQVHQKIGTPATWNPQVNEQNTLTLIEYFKSQIEIFYKGANLNSKAPDKEAQPVNAQKKIEAIKLIGDWDYDICQLEITYTDETAPRGALFGSNDSIQLKESVKEQQNFILTLPNYINSKERVNGIGKYQFLQTGYGVPSSTTNRDNYVGTLNDFKIKAVEFNAYQTRNVYDETVAQYKDVFNLKSNQNCTTLPGDSGGPLFGVVLGEEKFFLYLLGLTLGSDYFVNKQDEPATLKDDPDGKYNNGATSLSEYYQILTK